MTINDCTTDEERAIFQHIERVGVALGFPESESEARASLAVKALRVGLESGGTVAPLDTDRLDRIAVASLGCGGTV